MHIRGLEMVGCGREGDGGGVNRAIITAEDQA
jgi:hypothetical protein